MKRLISALAVVAIACAGAPPKPEGEATSAPAPVAESSPKEAVAPAAEAAPATPTESVAAPPDAGTTAAVETPVAAAPVAAKDAGVSAPKAVETQTAAPKPAAAKDAGTVAAKEPPAVAKPATPAKDAGTEAARPVVKEPAPVAVALGPVAAPDKKTERLWKSKCSACHGVDGKAATEKGKKMKMTDLTSAAWQKSRTDAQLKKAILEGIKSTKDGVSQTMDPYADELDAEQVKALIGFVRWVGAAK